MRHLAVCSGALLVSGAAALIQASGAETALRASAEGASLQRTATERESLSYSARSFLSVVETFSVGAEEESHEHPEWCVHEANLTWKQRRERMQNHETLMWAKEEMRKLVEANKTVPPWMEKVVVDDMNRGRLKWAVQEVKRLKAEGKDVPAWLADLSAEDARWGNRWAACKAAELKEHGEEVPTWMVENGRKGIIDYATEKAAEIRAQIDQLEEAKEKEVALVKASGDVKVAKQRMLASVKVKKVRSVDQQMRVLAGAIADLGNAEETIEHLGTMPSENMKQVAFRTREAYDLLGQVLRMRFAALRHQL